MIWEKPASQNRWTILGFKSPGSGWVCQVLRFSVIVIGILKLKLGKTALAQPNMLYMEPWWKTMKDENTWSENEGSCGITVKFGWCSCCDMGSTASVAARWQLLQDSLYFIAQPPGGVCLVLDWDTWQRSRWRQSGTCDKSASMQSPPVFFWCVFHGVSIPCITYSFCGKSMLKLKMAPNLTHFCFGGINRRFLKDEQLIHVTGHISRFCRMLHGPPVLLQGHGATRRIWTPGGWAAGEERWMAPTQRFGSRCSNAHIRGEVLYTINHTRFPMVCIFQAHIYIYIFTPLRVGWPPTPQVYFGPWEGLRVVFPRGGSPS